MTAPKGHIFDNGEVGISSGGSVILKRRDLDGHSVAEISNSRPIIIYRLGSLGDTVVALPCFHRIAQTFAGHRRLVLTNVPVASVAAPLELILKPSGLIHGVIDYPVGLRSPLAIWRLAQKIRAVGAHTLVYLSAPRGLEGVLRDLTFFRLCGLSRIVGAPLAADMRYNRVSSPDGVVEPEAERLARTLQALGPIDLSDRANWDLGLSVEETLAGVKALSSLQDKPFLAINVGGKLTKNSWGDDNWLSLLGRLAPRLPGYGLVAVGATDDAQRSAALLAAWPRVCVNLCGALAPRESAAALQRAKLFIGHDSGPMHLAAVVGTPTVGIFGNNNRPRLWHPYGAGHRPVHDLRGVRMVSVDDVLSAALEIAR